RSFGRGAWDGEVMLVGCMAPASWWSEGRRGFILRQVIGSLGPKSPGASAGLNRAPNVRFSTGTKWPGAKPGGMKNRAAWWLVVVLSVVVLGGTGVLLYWNWHFSPAFLQNALVSAAGRG